MIAMRSIQHDVRDLRPACRAALACRRRLPMSPRSVALFGHPLQRTGLTLAFYRKDARPVSSKGAFMASGC